MGVHVSLHALQRAIERIAGIQTEEQARALLTSPAILTAAQFSQGHDCNVRLPTGHRVTLRDYCVATVLPVDNYKRTVRRYKRGRYE